KGAENSWPVHMELYPNSGHVSAKPNQDLCPYERPPAQEVCSNHLRMRAAEQPQKAEAAHAQQRECRRFGHRYYGANLAGKVLGAVEAITIAPIPRKSAVSRQGSVRAGVRAKEV